MCGIEMFYTPMGSRPKARGCAARATLGSGAHAYRNPNGVVSEPSAGVATMTQPRWGWISRFGVPRVGRIRPTLGFGTESRWDRRRGMIDDAMLTDSLLGSRPTVSTNPRAATAPGFFTATGSMNPPPATAPGFFTPTGSRPKAQGRAGRATLGSYAPWLSNPSGVVSRTFLFPF